MLIFKQLFSFIKLSCSIPDLQIEVDDVLAVNVGHGLDDLPHEGRASLFGQDKLVLYHAVELDPML
jgi:hypothetical protein